MQNCKSRLVALVIFCLLAGSAQAAGSISLFQKLDRPQIAFEDSVTLELTLTWAGPQYAYRFDRPLQPTLSKLQIGPFSTAIGSTGSGPDEVTTKTFTYTLIPVGSGAARVEPITIAYVSYPDSIPGELVSEPMTVEVASPKPVEVEDSGIISWVIWGVLLVVVGLTAVLILRMRKSAITGEAMISPVERFMDNLNRLKNESGIDLKKFQTGLYGHLVQYLGDEYSLNLTNKNAAHIGEALRGTAIPDRHREKSSAGWIGPSARNSPQPPLRRGRPYGWPMRCSSFSMNR